MRVLIAGGNGMLGRELGRVLRAAGHEVVILTRTRAHRGDEVHWDGFARGLWEKELQDTEAVVNATGYGLQHWPWSRAMKRRFIESRVEPGRALAAAIERSVSRPRVFIQFSGINRYGLQGTGTADESWPAADDFLARLTVEWEQATAPVQELGIRHIVVRNAVVLHATQGLFPLMALPCRLFVGGRFGTGVQAVPWIHAADHARALRYLLEDSNASGPYNLIAPETSTNSRFMKAICTVLRRPFWLHLPAGLMRLILGEMAQLIVMGRPSYPRRLLESGFKFEFPMLDFALADILGGTGHQ